MKKINDKYRKKLDPKRVANRMELLENIVEVFEESLPGCLEVATTSTLLHATVVSHFLEVERFKEFHCGSTSDYRISYPKVAAFLIKWIAKLRPFSIVLKDGADSKGISKSEWEYYTVQVNALIAPLVYAVVTNSSPFDDQRILHELHQGSLDADALILLLET